MFCTSFAILTPKFLISYHYRYSSIGSFYFPALMMVIVYARIFIAARSRARRHIAKKRLKILPIEKDALKEKSTTTTICTSFSNPSPPENPNKDQLPISGDCNIHTCTIQVTGCQSGEDSCSNNGLGDGGAHETSSKIALPKSPPPQIIIEASSDSRRQSWNIISTSELVSSINICNHHLKDNGNNSVSSTNENSDVEQPAVSCNEPVDISRNDKPTQVYFTNLKSATKSVFRFRKPRLEGLAKTNSINKSPDIVDDDSDTADSPTSKENPNYESKAFLSAPKLLRSKFGSSLSIADYDDSDLMEDDKKRGKGRVQYHDPPVVGIHIPTDADRNKRKIAKARERRATLIVGMHNQTDAERHS